MLCISWLVRWVQFWASWTPGLKVRCSEYEECVAPCSLVEIYQPFEGTAVPSFPVVGRNRLLRNAVNFVPEYAASYPVQH
jgi:hypothetical protein